MDVKVNRRLTGAYGTANDGDTVTVDQLTGETYIENGWGEETSKINETATAEQISQRNSEGASLNAVHLDGTNREILNTDGRRLHESGADATAEALARVEAEVNPAVDGAPISKGDEDVRVQHDNDDIKNAKANKSGAKTITSADAE